ncbi:XRE family transcriptional regulator [Pseudomonas fluorescens]|uniref:HTH-type transcriptional regulator PrtR n=1 Tax=Pseudomonas fluorescens TaxID=294 RepID=A0A5E7E8E6_PSEFL|nr:LexA family transcriptional regulator [Pseudomonas fluorescens]VVO22837.1 HTH-type transcriptional regulator PrtR [Pseudomonas fluorescens]
MNNDDQQKSETVGTRLRAARLLLGLSQSQVAERAGLSQVSIQHLESGRNENSRHLVSVAKAVGVRPEWLFTGANPMVEGPISVQRPPADPYAVIDLLTATFSSRNGPGDESEVSAGLAFKKSWLKREGLDASNLRVIYAPDDSNEPTMSAGDALLVDRSQLEPRNGKLFAVMTPGDDIIIKRLVSDLFGGWIVSSDNPDKGRYPELKLSGEALSSINILGQVLWRGGKI